MKSWKHSLEYAVFRSLLFVFSLLPFSFRKILALGILNFAGWIKLNALAIRNLDLAYGSALNRKEKKRILRDLYRNLSRTAAELSLFYRDKKAFVESALLVSPSRELFLDAFRLGKGLIVVTPHFGNWELISTWSLLQGKTGAVVGKRLKNEKINQFLVALRSQEGMDVIYQHEGPRKILRVLAQQGVIGMLPDADTTRLDGIFVPYFGVQTYTFTGPASLSIVSGAPILPLFLVHENGKYRVHVEPLISPQTQERTDEEVRRITMAWSAAFEKVIRQYPEQWIWFQRRWVTTPESLQNH